MSTTPAELLKAYNAMDGSHKTRALKVVDEPPQDEDAEQLAVQAPDPGDFPCTG